MKRTGLFTIAGLLAISLWSCSPTEEKKETKTTLAAEATVDKPEDVEKTITDLEKQWTQAIVKKDVDTLDRILAKDFAGTSPTAHTYYRDNAIDDLKSGRYVVTSMDLDEISVNVYPGAAVAFTSQEEKSKYDGKDNSGHYHYTDVWIKRDGKWQAVASHGSRFDKPSPEELRKKK